MNKYAVSEKSTGEVIMHVDAVDKMQAFDIVEGRLGEVWRYHIDQVRI